MAFTRTWDETIPPGTYQRSTADDWIRNTKVDVRERLSVEHTWTAAGTANDGRHLISTKFHLTGTYAAIPAVDASYPGRTYWSTNVSGTNSPAVYYDTGAAWIKIATADHGNLAGLLDDDHTQYILVDGTRAIAGDLLPDATGTRCIGSALLKFHDLFLNGHLYCGNVANNLVPSVNATYDIGNSSVPLKWRDLFISRNASVGGTMTITGATVITSTLDVNSTLCVIGNAVFHGTISSDREVIMYSSLAVTGTLNVTNDTTVGDFIVGNFISHATPSPTNTYDLGSGPLNANLQWRDLFISRNASVGGTLGVTGAVTLSSTLAVGSTVLTGYLTVSSYLTVDGNVTLGNATTDTITCTGRLSSSLIPVTDATYDLGIATTNRWKDLYLSADSYSVNARVTTAVLPSVATATIGITGTRFNYGYFNYIETTNNVNAGSFTGTTLALTGELYMKNGQELIFNYLDGNNTFFRYDLSAHKLYLYVDGVLKESW